MNNGPVMKINHRVCAPDHDTWRRSRARAMDRAHMEGGAPTALSYFLSSDIQLKVKLHVLTIHGT